MNQDDNVSVILTAIDALNELTEDYGMRFKYHEETMGLSIHTKPGDTPDFEGLVNQIVTLCATLYSCMFEMTAFQTREQPLAIRHQELHRVFMAAGDILGSAYEAASQQMAADVEVATTMPVKH